MNKAILNVAAVMLTLTSSQASEKTGVGKNGVALASSPSFVTTKGEMVTMENVVRAETAKYFAEEIILTGANKFRHERNGIDLDNQTIIRSNPDDEGAVINNREIKLNADGKSFDVYFVHKEDFGKHDNELIAPTETFNTTMRVYLPGKSVIRA